MQWLSLHIRTVSSFLLVKFLISSCNFLRNNNDFMDYKNLNNLHIAFYLIFIIFIEYDRIDVYQKMEDFSSRQRWKGVLRYIIYYMVNVITTYNLFFRKLKKL